MGMVGMSELINLYTWVGGKTKIAREIISMMPKHQHYVECFFGSGVIFFNKPRVEINTINDVNNNIVNLMIQVRDHEKEFMEKVYWTLFSRKQYEIYLLGLQTKFDGYSDLDRAVAYLFLILSSFQNIVSISSSFTPSVTRNTADQFSLKLIEKIKEVRKLLDGVTIENRSFSEIIPKYDASNILLYCDPPYYSTSIGQDVADSIYEHNFDKNAHEYLSYFLMKSKSNWMLSYDSHPAIINMYKDYEQIKLKTHYNLKGKDKKIEELLILNFKHKKPQIDIFAKPEVELEKVSNLEKKNAIFEAERLAEEESKMLRKSNEQRKKDFDQKEDDEFIQENLF